MVQSNSMYGHLVWRQRLMGVSSVCNRGSSNPITTAVPSTYITYRTEASHWGQSILLAKSYEGLFHRLANRVLCLQFGILKNHKEHTVSDKDDAISDKRKFNLQMLPSHSNAALFQIKSCNKNTAIYSEKDL